MIKKELRNSTTQIFTIVENFGGENKQKLMKALNQLRHEVKYESYKAFHKRLLPLMTFEQFKDMK